MSEEQDKMIGRLVLGRYRILLLLAKGGMGAVYLARVEGAAGFAKPVIVKRMLPHLSDAADKKARFVREAQILSHLRHPGIVSVIDFGKQEDAHVMVLEYVHGFHLGQWLKYCSRKMRQLPWEAAVLVLLKVLSALQYAHTQTRSDGSRAGIIHRDISPSNILIDVDGNVLLADFGIARVDAEQSTQEQTGEGMFNGKLPYAAPELFANKKASASSDIYACGVVLYQALAGVNPFSAREVSSIVQRVLTVVPPNISTQRPDVPVELDAVVSKALAKEPSNRFASADEFASALRSILRVSETALIAQMTASIRADFTGDLPRILQVKSLDELEEAWQRANHQSGMPDSSYPPPQISLGRVPILASMPPTVSLGMARARTPTGSQAFEPSESRSAPVPLPGQEPAARVPRRAKHRIVLIVTGAVLLIAVSAFGFVWSSRPAASGQPRFVVVESRAESDLVQPPPSAPTEVAAVNATPNPDPAPNASSPKTTRAPAQRDSGSSLSRTFAKRQGAIQSCFQRNAMNVIGAPELSIRFSTDARGNVTAAAVRPATVAATALGQCLESVARSTAFGPQDGPLTFSIPITARVR
jgi:serine/threonine-protein kinase